MSYLRYRRGGTMAEVKGEGSGDAYLDVLSYSYFNQRRSRVFHFFCSCTPRRHELKREKFIRASFIL